jgi:hypothetical protein
LDDELTVITVLAYELPFLGLTMTDFLSSADGAFPERFFVTVYADVSTSRAFLRHIDYPTNQAAPAFWPVALLAKDTPFPVMFVIFDDLFALAAHCRRSDKAGGAYRLLPGTQNYGAGLPAVGASAPLNSPCAVFAYSDAVVELQLYSSVLFTHVAALDSRGPADVADKVA